VRVWNTTDLAARSVALILEHQAPSGAYPACPAFAPYRYCWFRDGSFVADAMSRCGKVASAEAFFDWCARVIVSRGGKRLHARYTLDGRESDETWPTFQLDGYGLWLRALREHGARHGRSVGPHEQAVELTLGYLARSWREPCTDWWEERVGIHAATLACVQAGLAAWEHESADDAKTALDRLTDIRLDASLLVFPFLGLELPRPVDELVSPGGGVHRHLEDTYYGGGEWLLLTSFLGLADEARAQDCLEWVAAHATPEGHLPEQSQDYLLAPHMLEPWIAKWGPPASPLLWSHAMFLTLAAVLSQLP
jgi:GH15 family glucan-1,4-alpha-glucosidase